MDYRTGMRPVSVGNVPVYLEAAEAGTRYFAPILILPGLFQSFVCWRGLTSMLAHRGWDVYVMPRTPPQDPAHDAGDARMDPRGWTETLEATADAASRLAEQVIVLGADIGGSAALELSDAVRPMALGLFGPVDPSAVGTAFDQSMGFFGRRRLRRQVGPILPSQAIADGAHQRSDVASEPRPLIEDLIRGVPFRAPTVHPPAIVFRVENDPLVDDGNVDSFLRTDFAKEARSRLNGRFWPSLGGEAVASEVHRFLILTLSDRVVDFPDDVIAD